MAIKSLETQKPGKWIYRNEDNGYFDNCYQCSNCAEVFFLENGTPQDNEYHFCPNCGADMRGVRNG
jgi:predicted RNA-binding Zn-ribbon protein involved in translation (DUF1610 family)